MANLANVYAYLCSSYGENFTMTYASAPTYLKQIVGPNEMEKIVFIYKEDRNKENVALVSPKKLKEQNAELDLTGSPLKDDCAVDTIADVSLDFQENSFHLWSQDEEFHKGISVEKARNIFCVKEEFQRGKSASDAKGSVWVLCSGSDAEKTIFFQYEFERGFNSRGLVTFLGIVPTSQANAREMLRHHNALIRHETKRDTFIENTYRIKPNILLRCSWNTTAAVPTLINLSSCDVTLTQTFRLNGCNQSSEEFMNQLRILMYIRNDILAYKNQGNALDSNGSGVGNEPIYRCGRGIDIEDLREGVNKVMNELSGFAEIDDENAAEFDIEAVVQRAKMRRLTDLTDKLWNLLKCCSSYKDLKMAFNVVFQCAAKCNIVNTPTNKNRLAEIITEIANHRLAIPCLSGTEPLELLLEIGIEKLYKDYEFIFTESKICRASDLRNQNLTDDTKRKDAPLNVRKSIRNAMRPDVTSNSRKTLLHSNIQSTKKMNDDILCFKNSNFNANETILQLAKLLQIHCTMEHLLMLQINLNLNNVHSEVCEQLLQKPVRIMDTIDDSLVDEMDIILSPHDVRELLEGKDPHTIRVKFNSNNKFRYTNTTCFYCMENICPPGVSDCFQTEDSEYDKNNIYYCWLYRKIKTVCQAVTGSTVNKN